MARFRYRVLFLTSWYPHPGNPFNGIFVKRKAEALRHRADVAVLFVIGTTQGRSGLWVEKSLEAGVPTWRATYRRPSTKLGPLYPIFDRLYYLMAGSVGLRQVWKGFGRPDLVHLHIANPAGYLALALKRLIGIPYVLTEHCDLALRVSRGWERLGTASRWLMRLIIRQAEQVTVDSSAMRQALCELGFRRDAKVVGNIVTLPGLRSKPAAGSGLKLVHLSTLWDRQKNISGLLQAVSEATAKLGPGKLTLAIVGEGPDRTALESLSRRLGLADIVRFHGAVDDGEKERLLSQADCFVLSSNFEGFSVATAEALLAGLPVIVTDCGGPQDFTGPDNSLRVPTGDQGALAAAIIRMSREKHRFSRSRIARRAREIFDPVKVVEATLEIYDQVPVRWTAGLSWERIRVRPEWLVLDVGSGHNPNSRADVLLDCDLQPSIHRTGKETLRPEGRAMVVGDATCMPFADGVFDFTIASHVAEHVEEVEALLGELQRVSRAGYIETPGPLTEFLFNIPYHRWAVSRRGQTIVFRRKTGFRVPSRILFAAFNLNQDISGRQTYRSQNPAWLALHRVVTRAWKRIPPAYVRYHWQGTISYEVRR